MGSCLRHSRWGQRLTGISRLGSLGNVRGVIMATWHCMVVQDRSWLGFARWGR